MADLSRRDLLVGAAGLTLASPTAALAQSRRRFRFVHLTDLHMRRTNGAKDGIQMAIASIARLRPRPDFLIFGGDVLEGLRTSPLTNAQEMLAWHQEAVKAAEMPGYYVMGNHDVLGWSEANTERQSALGKRFYQDALMKRDLNSSFGHKGWHFVLLDSVRLLPDGGYDGFLDDATLAWLKSDLDRVPEGTPIAISTHIPLISAYHSYVDGPTVPTPNPMLIKNAKEVHELLRPYPVKVVLQGHTHVRETVQYAGRQHVTSGAVCGQWWAGPRLGIDPEGYSVLDVDGDDVRVSYATTGWKART